VDLVHVEFMVLLRYVLNDPFFHRFPAWYDRRRIVVVEQRWLLARITWIMRTSVGCFSLNWNVRVSIRARC